MIILGHINIGKKYRVLLGWFGFRFGQCWPDEKNYIWKVWKLGLIQIQAFWPGIPR